ncbi:MAG: hypothetical protein AB1730_05515 [Myxococcota bacterium]
MIALLGLAVLHVTGAVILSLASRRPLRVTVRQPSAAIPAIGVLGLASLGAAGVSLLAALGLSAWLVRPAQAQPLARFPWRLFSVGALLVLARPWVPTQWDEYVWLGKARLESLGFGAGVRAALDATQHLVPPGYPALWPSAVGWVSLGRDALATHTLAATLLVLLCAAVALEAWAPLVTRPRPLALAVALAAPLAWVHLRSTYVDLPVGLMGLALLGQLLASVEGRPPIEALFTAVVLAGFKDEGLAHVLAASAAGWLVSLRRRDAWRLAVPAALALLSVGAWRLLLHGAGVVDSDHALGLPYWPWLPKLGALVWLHATDVFSWGVFWAVAVAVLLRGASDGPARAARWLVVLDFAFVVVELLCGPERVRAFAENGTLVNRLLVQLWPAAAALVVLALGAPDAPTATSPAAPAGRATPRSEPRLRAPMVRRRRRPAAAGAAP